MVSEIWFCSANLEFFHHGTAKGGGKHSVLLLRRREEVVHIPKVVTHTRTSHQHVEQTVEVPRKKKQHFFLSGFFLEENMSAETSNGFWDWQGMFFLYWVESLQIYFHRCRCLFLCNRKNRFTFQRSWPKRVPWMRMTCFWLRCVTIISHLNNCAQMRTPTMKVSYVDGKILEMFWKIVSI